MDQMAGFDDADGCYGLIGGAADGDWWEAHCHVGLVGFGADRVVRWGCLFVRVGIEFLRMRMRDLGGFWCLVVESRLPTFWQDDGSGRIED